MGVVGTTLKWSSPRKQIDKLAVGESVTRETNAEVVRIDCEEVAGAEPLKGSTGFAMREKNGTRHGRAPPPKGGARTTGTHHR